MCFRQFRFALLVPALAAVTLVWAQQPAKTPPAGINDTWKGNDVDALVGRLEAESREIYRERARIANLIGPSQGAVIADIGAGSGFMVEEFAKRVGKTGKVFAVDINAKMLERIVQRAKQLGYPQVQTVLAKEDSVELLPDSLDIAFVCDTYHHFEHPQKSLAGIHRALRTGGSLYLVEFHRIPGTSPDFVMTHVRGGKEDFIKEITAAGFTLRQDYNVPFLKENYILRFRKN